MIELHGTKWTTKDETMAAFKFFREKYGDEVQKPECSFGSKPCGNTTCYIVEDAEVTKRPDGASKVKFKRPGAALLVNVFKQVRYLVKGSQVYLPVLMCHKCEAALEGASTASNPASYAETYKAIDAKGLTPAEASDYKRIFKLAFDKKLGALTPAPASTRYSMGAKP